jgi:ATP-dependent DNA helicase RecQ
MTNCQSNSNRRYALISEAYNSGETIQGLMERYHVTQGTIHSHLTRYLSAGNTLRKGEDLQELTFATFEQLQVVFAVFHELSPNFLKPVYEKLNGRLNYDELKISRMYI